MESLQNTVAMSGRPAGLRSRVRVPSERALRIATAVVAAVGIGVASYIAIVEAGGGSPVCLSSGRGCETVASSEYAELAGVNVALIGVIGYVSLLGAALVPGDLGRLGGLALALIGFGFSVYLTYLELFVIEAVCQWCVASATLMTLMLVLTASRALAYAATDLRGAPALDDDYDEEEDESPDG